MCNVMIFVSWASLILVFLIAIYFYYILPAEEDLFKSVTFKGTIIDD